MAENSTIGNPPNGDAAREAAADLRERARAKASVLGDKMREGADSARSWARGRMDRVQSSVEANPWRAGAWALGIGLVAGVLLTSLVRGRR